MRKINRCASIHLIFLHLKYNQGNLGPIIKAKLSAFLSRSLLIETMTNSWMMRRTSQWMLWWTRCHPVSTGHPKDMKSWTMLHHAADNTAAKSVNHTELAKLPTWPRSTRSTSTLYQTSVTTIKIYKYKA